MTKHSQQSRYRVDGMDCASCAAKIDTAVRRVPGVEDVSVSATAGTMTVRHGDDEAVGPAITKTVTGLGYKLRLLTEHSIGDGGPKAVEACGCQGRSGPDAHAHDDARKSEGPEHRHHNGQNDGKASSAELHGHDHGPTNGPWWRSGKGRLTIASGIALIAAYAIGKLVPGFEPWIFTAAMLVGLVPIARRAIMAAIAGTPFSIEMLMTIAAVGAVAISASEEAATVVFLFLIGELLEGVAAGRARASIQSLTALLPKTALLEEGGKTREVPAEDLIVDSLILVRPGDRIPADGLIVSGESAIDEAPVTGESTPVRKGVDAIVFAGTVNGEAALRIRVTAAAADNTIARVVKLDL